MRPAFISKLANAGRRYGLTWRYGFNLRPTLAYMMKRHQLSGEIVRVVSELNSSGIAITSADKLFESSSCYDELKSTVEGLENEQAHTLDEARKEANSSDSIGAKTFIVELLSGRPLLDVENIYARFALQKEFLQISNAYFGMYTRLRYYNIWHTFASQGTPRESQLWHQDREDHQILKVFVYFSDVDEGAGPFTYAPGTHPKGKVKGEPEYFMEGVVKRSDDNQMDAVLSKDKWIKAIGRKGTIVFADTRGYHKGGLARENDRIMYVSMHTSRASQSKELFELPRTINLPDDEEQSFALWQRS